MKKLQWDPQLRLFFQNYDKDGRWIPDGLKNLKMQRDKTTKLELGMTELTQFTVEELKDFCKRLNKIVTANNPKRNDYIQALTEAHIEGQRMLNADNGQLFRDQRLKTFVQLQKKDINKMKHTELRHYGKRLGITTAATDGKDKLAKTLIQKLNEQHIIVDTNHDVEMKNNSAVVNGMDIDGGANDVVTQVSTNNMDSITNQISAMKMDVDEMSVATDFEMQEMQNVRNLDASCDQVHDDEL